MSIGPYYPDVQYKQGIFSIAIQGYLLGDIVILKTQEMGWSSWECIKDVQGIAPPDIHWRLLGRVDVEGA